MSICETLKDDWVTWELQLHDKYTHSCFIHEQQTCFLRFSPLNSHIFFSRTEMFFFFLSVSFVSLRNAYCTKRTTWRGQDSIGILRGTEEGDLSLRDTKLCNILIKRQAFMNSPMRHAKKLMIGSLENAAQCRISWFKDIKYIEPIVHSSRRRWEMNMKIIVLLM